MHLFVQLFPKFHCVEYYYPQNSERNDIVCYIALLIPCQGEVRKLGHLLPTYFSSSIKLNSPLAGMFSTTSSFIVYDGVYWAWLGFDS